jgi:cytochrome P450
MSALLPAAAFSAGIATHLLWYKQYEFHVYPLRNIQAFLLAVTTVVVARIQYQETPIKTAVSSTLSLTGVFIAGIFSSVLVYRLVFNPLNKIPGPFFARISKFDSVFRNTNFDGHIQLLKLHQKYGRFVRIGPNDLSVADPDATQVISAPNSKCTKAPWYDGDEPRISMHTTRDRALHDRRRRIWAPAFSDKALRGYEGRIKVYNDILIQQLGKMTGEPVNVSKWFNLYSFDVMGDLGFGESFNMLESGEEHWAIALLNAGMDPMGLWFPTWFFRTIVAIPGAAKDYFRFIDYCTNQIKKRISKGKDANPDIAGYLVEAFEKSENKKDAMSFIAGDSRLIIVAGSDTTAATLSHLYYHLAKNPDIVEKLRKEVEPMMEANGEVNHTKIQDAQYLNGCINETLRLNPPVPCGVFRKTPKEGVHIGSTFIDGNTVLQMPGYVMARGELLGSPPLL